MVENEAKEELLFEVPEGFKEVKGEFWIPSIVGESVTGIIHEIKEHPEYGKSYVLMAEGGRMVTLPAHKVIQSRLGFAKVNDMIHIIYTGEEAPKLKGHKPTKMYQVYIK